MLDNHHHHPPAPCPFSNPMRRHVTYFCKSRFFVVYSTCTFFPRIVNEHRVYRVSMDPKIAVGAVLKQTHAHRHTRTQTHTHTDTHAHSHTRTQTHTHTYTSKSCTSRKSVSPLSRLIRGFRNKYL